MCQLDLLGKGQEKLSLIEEVSPDWEKVASRLGLSDHVVRIIKYDTIQFGCEKSCRESFRRWLDGKGYQPITWERLIEALVDADRCTLADRLQCFLIDS